MMAVDMYVEVMAAIAARDCRIEIIKNCSKTSPKSPQTVKYMGKGTPDFHHEIEREETKPLNAKKRAFARKQEKIKEDRRFA
jgi:hypothetical protein